ncbi:MAG: hypothetical protein QF718_01605 [Phycisphaerales bacterium]|jgi:hypothetical protein|nr:hypothetical protein [Phycisphaerales bacterium]
MVIEVGLFLSILSTIGEPPPLTKEDYHRLEVTSDGKDTLDEGFSVLSNHVRMWDSTVTTTEKSDLSLIKKNPSIFRGNLFMVSGMIEQMEELPSTWKSSQEWFVRDEEGNPFILYVVGDINIDLKSRIRVPARFYKTISLTSRDNRLRMYPTFVTTSKVLDKFKTANEFPTPILLLPVIAVASVVVFVLGRVKKSSFVGKSVLHVKTNEVLEAINESSGSLPEDPAEALASMYEESESES